MILSEIENEITKSELDLDIVKTEMGRLYSLWDIERNKKKKLKKHIGDFNRSRDEVIFQNSLTTHYKPGDEIYPSHKSLGNSRVLYIRHLSQDIDNGTPIIINNFNPKTIRFSFTLYGIRQVKTISFAAFGLFLKRFTDDGTRLRRSVRLGEVLNK